MRNRIAELAKAVKEHPEDSFYKFTLALEMIKAGKLDKAKILFQHIKNNDPEYVGVYYHLGKLHEQMNEPHQAIQVYKAGILVAEKQNDAHTKSELNAVLMNLELEID